MADKESIGNWIAFFALVIAAFAFFNDCISNKKQSRERFSCTDKSSELFVLLHNSFIDLNEGELSNELINQINSKLRNPIDSYSNADCNWTSQMDSLRRLIIEDLWTYSTMLANENSSQNLLPMIELMELLCNSSKLGCSKSDNERIEKLRRIYNEESN